MRAIVFLGMFLCCLPALTAQSNLLDKTVSFSWDSIPISQFLDSLSSKYQFSFSYDASIVPGDSMIYAEEDSVVLGGWLKQMLGDEELNIHQLESQVIISEEPAKIAPGAIHVQGVVIDSLDETPMGMVNVGVIGKTIGTATNRSGQFSLYVPHSYAGEKLVVSNLGYLREQIEIPSRDTMVQVELRETSVRLPEVLVRHVEPMNLMQEVVRRKRANYASDPLILTAFFRESIQQDEQYVDVSEAVIEIYKPPYTSEFALERVRFVKGRKGEFTGDMEIIDFKLQGGPFLFSRVDIVRQGGFLPNQEGNSKYQYSFEGMDYDHGRNVFVIGFEPRNDDGELLYEGEIRIDEETLAIVGANFEMTRRTIRKSREYLIRRDSRRFRTKPIFAKYRIDYRPWGDKWVLNSVRGEVSMKIADRKKNVRTEFNTVSEMLITDLREGNRKEFRWSESFKANYILSEEIESYDPEFWSRYNIISPDESIREIFNGKASGNAE
ncbi:carboxypeptidase-like regulatory domain-containing protein [Marinilabilia rubra]|nr:carboxypeptidase-like regulatory domain-containing protein [Marinilabilia rubra]